MLKTSITVYITYENGAKEMRVNGKPRHIIYNNGDMVWFDIVDNEYKVCGVLTHDQKMFGHTAL